MKTFKTIIWDWNGTLLNDGDFSKEIINGMLKDRGLKSFTMEEHQAMFDFPVQRYYERVGFDLEAEPFEVLSEQFVQTYISGVLNCDLFAEAVELLQSIRTSGWQQVILSASRQDYLENMVRHYGLTEYFTELLGIDSIHAPGKTGRGVEWVNSSGLDKREILLIGDTFHDHEVAAAMGVECWLVAAGHHGKGKLERSGRIVYNTLGEVAEKLLA